MPLNNPLGYLKNAFNFATTDLASPEMLGGGDDQNAIDAPALERSPWEARLRGFAAGALGGVGNRDQMFHGGVAGMSSPLDIASNAAAFTGAGKALGALKGLRAGAGPASRAKQAFDIIENIPVKQVNPGMGEVDDLINQLGNNIARIPSRVR